MDFPTPDEEFELMYGEELEMMDEFDGKFSSFLQCLHLNELFL